MSRIEKVLSGKKGNEKVLLISKFSFSIIILVLALLQLIGIWDKAIYVFEPLIGILMLIQTLENWNKNRKIAIFSLCVALFVFACAVIILADIILNS